MATRVLEVQKLEVEFRVDDRTLRAVDRASFTLDRGETLGLVGESGSGKSVTCLAILGLLPQPPARIVGGRAIYEDRNLLGLDRFYLNQIRGHQIAMIFQDPMTSLNPYLTVGEQLTELTRRHLLHTHAEARRHAAEMLDRVGIPSADRRLDDYPHQFSGGMRQRVMIAMAMSCKPDILIADEPTTALDVTIQAQILELMRDLQREEGTAIILISHDLGVIANMCHRVHVMYAGRIVEKAPIDELFRQPRHPYTLGLMRTMPRLGGPARGRLEPIPGQPPDLAELPTGCAFHPRCGFAADRCRAERPKLAKTEAGHAFACHFDLPSLPGGIVAPAAAGDAAPGPTTPGGPLDA